MFLLSKWKQNSHELYSLSRETQSGIEVGAHTQLYISQKKSVYVKKKLVKPLTISLKVSQPRISRHRLL